MLTASVVRPKTPRGDENSRFPRTGRTRSRRSCRQTQNPARGRELEAGLLIQDRLGALVVRPKTPRGDENLHSGGVVPHSFFGSSDPKPREGTRTSPSPSSDISSSSSCRQTQNPARGREPRGSHRLPRDAPRRQTQNPARGRELQKNRQYQSAQVTMSSDPKPREGTRTRRVRGW